MKLCVIGLGQMGSTLVQGILDQGVFSAEEIIGCDLRHKELEASFADRITTTADNRVGARQAEVILLAVKPQVIDQVLTEIKDLVEDKLLISIAAGVTIDRIKNNLPASVRLVRVMPNTPALVKAGISALSFSDNCTTKDRELTHQIFCGVGEVIAVKEEMMDAITGLSGSGPAYVYTMIEALSDGGVLKGLPRKQALKLAAATVLGSAKMVLETEKHPAELKDMVTSPGGTTIAGLEELESGAFRSLLIKTVKRATERSEELGN
ncbi:MAG: pyrroline-5-carboxylate reductase [Bacillota bacterium]